MAIRICAFGMIWLLMMFSEAKRTKKSLGEVALYLLQAVGITVLLSLAESICTAILPTISNPLLSDSFTPVLPALVYYICGQP